MLFRAQYILRPSALRVMSNASQTMHDFLPHRLKYLNDVQLTSSSALLPPRGHQIDFIFQVLKANQYTKLKTANDMGNIYRQHLLVTTLRSVFVSLGW